MTRVLVVDHRDSFVFTLVAYLRELGADVDVVESDALDAARAVSLAERSDAVLLSPGPGRPDAAPASLALVAHAVETGHPLLGVCLGHQVVAHALGARVAAAPEQMHGRTSAVVHGGDPLFDGLPSGFAAMRYHSLVVERATLPDDLIVTATTDGGVVMGLRHRRAPVAGVQFHPESVLTEGGRRLLANWLHEAATARRDQAVVAP